MLKPTKMVLQLANHSTRLARGMVEDVLIEVGEFILSVKFIMLETEVVTSPKKEILVILGRPSLLPLMLSLIVGMEK